MRQGTNGASAARMAKCIMNEYIGQFPEHMPMWTKDGNETEAYMGGYDRILMFLGSGHFCVICPTRTSDAGAGQWCHLFSEAVQTVLIMLRSPILNICYFRTAQKSANGSGGMPVVFLS